MQRGQAAIGEQAQVLIADFIRSQRGKGGGAIDKQEREDIYYTSFGWLLQSIFGVEDSTSRRREYLESIDPSSLDVIHYAAYMRCRLLASANKGFGLGTMMALLKSTPVRQKESFENWPNGDADSPYSSFLWYSLLEDTRNEKLWSKGQNLADYLAEDGGYANLKQQQQGSVNATAAALMVLGQTEGFKAETTGVEQLRNMQLPSGGFKATAETPMPDLLSTATALFTLRCYGVEPLYLAEEFIEAHWLDNGGFAATLLDNSSDVEYLFYGLLALGTL